MASLRAFVPLAIAMHAATIYFVARLPLAPKRPPAPLHELLFELDELQPDERVRPRTTPEDTTSLRTPRSSRPSFSPGSAALAPQEPGQVEPTQDSAVSTLTEATDGEPPVTEGAPELAPAPRRKINLGLGDPGAFGMGAPGEATLPVQRARRLEEHLEAILSGDDSDPFSTRSAPLVAAAREVLRDAGPLDGRAVISVYLDASGKVLRTERIAGGSSWDEVIERLRPRLKNTRANVPKHSRGMRVDLELTIRNQRPSGADGRKLPLALDKLSPEPRVGGSFDVSDLSGITQRIASVRVLTQTKL